MNTRKTIIATVLLAASNTVNAAPITELIITGGQFTINNMEIHNSSITPGAFASMSVDGSYDGEPLEGWLYDGGLGPREADYLPTSIVAFEFSYFGPFGVYTTATDNYDTNATYPGVTGDLTGSDLTLDLSSWTVFWDEDTFNQGSANVLSTVDINGNFTASWDALFTGGAFAPGVGNWTITGQVSTIPLPASLWLFGSGLISLIGLARRKKA